MNKNILSALLWLLTGCIFLTGCYNKVLVEMPDDEQSGLVTEITDEVYYANVFGKEVLGKYYLWNEEIADDLDAWNVRTNADPIATVDGIRYHKGDTYFDKWSLMTDNVDRLTANINGISTAFGWDITVYRLYEGSNQCIGVVNFVYHDTPAERLGLKRGDVIIGLSGEALTTENFLDLYYSSTLTVSLGCLDMETYCIVDRHKEVRIAAESIYESPILCDSVYEFAGKKVGYLAYTSFDLRSIDRLVEIGRHFKAEGIKELILDLRYNGGGYVLTENILASILAPEEVVESHALLGSESYNNLLAAQYEGQDKTYFSTEFNYPAMGVEVNIGDANIGLEKIYGLIGSESASASEALLSGLMPYMDVRLIGAQSYGKYCTGWIISAREIYEECPPEIDNWGIYVMVSVHRNVLGQTLCMPSGLKPDVEVVDNPLLPYQLGDVNEPLLRQALTEAGFPYVENGQIHFRSVGLHLERMADIRKLSFGKRIAFPDLRP